MCFLRRKKKPKEEIPQLPDFIEGESIDDFEAHVIDLIQEHRTSIKLSVLGNNKMLNRIATIHSKHMASENKASHKDFPERDYKCRIYANAKKVKEIVAGGYGTAKGVIGKEPYIDENGELIEKGWLGSELHRKAIEWKKAKEYGISIEKGSDNRFYYTVIFISK